MKCFCPVFAPLPWVVVRGGYDVIQSKFAVRPARPVNMSQWRELGTHSRSPGRFTATDR